MENTDTYSVSIGYEDAIIKLNELVKENERLKNLLNYERAQRIIAEQKIAAFEAKKRKPKTQEEKERDAVAAASKYKTNGVKKASAVSEIRSYTDFKAIQNYFLSKGDISGARNYLLLTLGVCMGSRISDLVGLRFCQFFDDDMKPRERVMVFERKTSKINNCLITEAMVDAFSVYFKVTQQEFSFDAYIFPSRKGGHITPKHGWMILDEAQKALGLDYNLGSHSLRKTFANIVACVDSTHIDMGTIEKVQGLLNHGDSKTTLRYLGALQRVYDKARMSVSDFVLGRTDIDELDIQSSKSIDDVFCALEELSKKIDNMEAVKA